MLVNADVRSRDGVRLFTQVGAARERGRKPTSRSHEWSDFDLIQAFADLPIEAGDVTITARVGRQELDLFGNRLFQTREGGSLPRTFEGARVDAVGSAATLTVMSFRPIKMERDAFSDRVDREEQFNAFSILLPAALPGGTLNVFGVDRRRERAEYLNAQGRERRYSLGVRYLGAWRDWRLEAQATGQTGRVSNLPVKAYGVQLALDRKLGGPFDAELGLDLVVTSGDKASTWAIETFDPIYPNPAGLAAPLLHPSNYIYGGVALTANWGGATWTGAVQRVSRESLGDAVYAAGDPLRAAFGRKRPTSVLTHLNVRRKLAPTVEAVARVAHAEAVGGLKAAGGRDVVYWRLDLTSRF